LFNGRWSMRAILRASLLIGVVCIQQAQAQQTRYSAKFVIGTSNGEVLSPGQYFTAINVHNPNGTAVTIRKRFAIALPSERPGPISQFASTTIPPGAAIEIDTRDIHRHTNTQPGTFVKGFVVINSTGRLNVVGVYTASGTSSRIVALFLERVPSSPLAAGAAAAREDEDDRPAGKREARPKDEPKDEPKKDEPDNQ